MVAGREEIKESQNRKQKINDQKILEHKCKASRKSFNRGPFVNFICFTETVLWPKPWSCRTTASGMRDDRRGGRRAGGSAASLFIPSSTKQLLSAQPTKSQHGTTMTNQEFTP